MCSARTAAPASASSTSHYRPSAAPGARLPHLWLGPGRSLYDALGPEWEASAAERGVPLTRLRLHRPDLREVVGADLLLVRPDRHVAWRGGAAVDAGALLDTARGCPPAIPSHARNLTAG